jgi:hypothetical protein
MSRSLQQLKNNQKPTWKNYMYTTSICDAAIGSVAFEQQPIDSEFIEQWIDRAIELFDADERTASASWKPELSEIVVSIEDDDDLYGLDEGDDVDEYYYKGKMGLVAIALECMDDAFEQLCNES